MAARIRLFRTGGLKTPYYRIVVTDSTSPRDGKFIEVIGHYDPAKGIENAKLNAEIYREWVRKGALPTDTVRNIAKKLNI